MWIVWIAIPVMIFVSIYGSVHTLDCRHSDDTDNQRHHSNGNAQGRCSSIL